MRAGQLHPCGNLEQPIDDHLQLGARPSDRPTRFSGRVKISLGFSGINCAMCLESELAGPATCKSFQLRSGADRRTVSPRQMEGGAVMQSQIDPWLVLRTRSHQENTVELCLRQKQITAYLPKHHAPRRATTARALHRNAFISRLYLRAAARAISSRTCATSAARAD